jgi:hypothetical protein
LQGRSAAGCVPLKHVSAPAGAYPRIPHRTRRAGTGAGGSLSPRSGMCRAASLCRLQRRSCGAAAGAGSLSPISGDVQGGLPCRLQRRSCGVAGGADFYCGEQRQAAPGVLRRGWSWRCFSERTVRSISVEVVVSASVKHGAAVRRWMIGLYGTMTAGKVCRVSSNGYSTNI